MPVNVTIKIDNILNEADLAKIENNVLKLEQYQRRTDTAKAKISRSKKGGIFSSDEVREALPSAFIKKRQRQEALGLSGGRLLDSNTKYNPAEKIRGTVDNSKNSTTEGILSSLGIRNIAKRKFTKDSLVSGSGSPIKGNNEFLKLRDKINKIEYSQESISKVLTRGQSLVSGAAGLSSVNGIVNTGLGFASKIPIVGAIIAIATAAAIKIWDEYQSQYEKGGTRDRRKKILAGDVSLIGVDNENAIYSGENLFLSNPQNIQGLPKGKSNTQELRDGVSRYNQRNQGSY